MKPFAIEVQGLGKRYQIGQLQTRNDTLRDSLVTLATSPLRRYRTLRRREQKDESADFFWALKDVNFTVTRGEVVGIIGRNGAGKSTLLKILSRITEPTEGRIKLRGRVGSLLEVGTGFHPELTGRENVFLNGAILGMHRTETARKFDEIVAFSGVEKFIDTPVKRYSSGMYLRLAFAVAAHLEPEILLVDEVLAVGDVEFQKKCLGKMGDIAGEGRTVLLVSHNMAAIQALCERALLLSQGQLITDLPAQEAVQEYLRSMDSLTTVELSRRTNRRGNQHIQFVDIWLEDEKGYSLQQAISGQPLRICLRYAGESKSTNVSVGLTVYTLNDVKVFHCNTRYASASINSLPASGVIVCELPRVLLVPGRYHINLSLRYNDDVLADSVERAMALDVIPGDFYGTGKLPRESSGHVLVDHTWQVRTGETVSSEKGE